MSFSLGQAKLILDVDAQPLIEGEAVAWKATRQGAQAVSSFLAKENNVRVSDVKKAASIIIDENKKVARETLKAEKAAAAERKKLIIDGIKNEVAQLKEAERYRKERARAIVAEEKRIENERLANVRKAFAEEAALRRKREQDEKAELNRRSRTSAASSSGGSSGLLGTGISGARAGATAATLLGFGAIASTAVIARAAVVGLTEATLKQDEAQRALNASFGKSAVIYKDLSDSYTKQFSLLGSTVDKAVASLGTLNRQSNLSSAQIKQLGAVAIDLQAAYGGDLQEAFRSAGAAVLGETEALEKYGIVLQDSVLQTLPQLTESEKKRFTTMSESEKQLIRYRVLMDLAKDAQGAATQRAKEAQGGFNEFNNATNKLALTLGKDLVPALGEAARGFAGLINDASDVVESFSAVAEAREELAKELGRPLIVGETPFKGKPGENPFFDFLNELDRAANGPSDDDLVAERVQNIKIRRAVEQEKKLKAARDKEFLDDLRKQENIRVDIINAANKRVAEIAKRELEEAAAREVENLENRIEFEERIRENRLNKLEEQKKAELENLEAIEYARKQASNAELERIQKEKTAVLRAADEKRDIALREIQVEREAANDAAQEQIRQAEIGKDRRTELNERNRDNAVKAVEDERDRIQQVRLQEDRDVEDSLTRQDRAREEQHTKNVRRFEREGEALRESYDKAIRKLEDKEKDDDERHDKRGKQIDSEARKQLEAIDKQIKALDDAERAEDARRRRRDLAQKRSAAQTTLFRALGSQDPNEIAGAREKLTQAIRIGDPEAVRKAQEELLDISGKGRDAVAEAQQDLANIEEDLISENVKQTNDAIKDKLNAEKDAIQKTLDLEKRQDDERNTRRKNRLDRDKQAEKDRLDDALKKLERRSEAEADAYKKDKQGAEDAKEAAKRALDDRRTAEDEAYKGKLQQIKDTYENEQRAIKATYDDEETGLIPAIRRALNFANTQYTDRERKVRETYESEREQIEDTYDGLISQHRASEESAQRAHTLALAAANAHYDAEQKKIKETYENTNGTGILDNLRRLKKVTEDELKLDLLEWEKWERGLNGPDGVLPKTWAQAKKAFQEFLNDMKQRGSFTIKPVIISPVTVPSFNGDSSDSDASRNPSTGGGGPGPGNLPTVQPTPGPGIGTGEDAGEVDVSPERFTTTFGFQAVYTTPFNDKIPRHRGVDLVIKGARNGGFGQPVGAFRPGRVYAVTEDRNGGNGVTVAANDGLYDRYFHFDSMNVRTGQQVKRGQQIGILGDTGTKGSPHLHYEVVSPAGRDYGDFESGPNPQINPVPYMQARDSGTTFRNPTMYMDMVTRERGIMAERGPETLLGSRDTQNLRNMLAFAPRINNAPQSYGESPTDYSILGLNLSKLGTGGQPVVVEGDKMVYNGVAPETLMQQWRDDQRRQRVLRGGR